MTRAEARGRLSEIHRFLAKCAPISSQGLHRGREPIEEAQVLGIRGKQRLDFSAQELIAGCRRSQECPALSGGLVKRRLKERLDARPSVIGHGRASDSISRLSHAL